jgi:methionyl aminopeptidase
VRMMTELAEDALKKYQRAGKIAHDVREAMKRNVRVGMPIIDVCEKAESLIVKKGGELAFPCNVSINEIAAHYTSAPEDKGTIPENSLVKVDLGVHVDGYIADTAVTVCFNPGYENLVSTAEAALKEATETLRPGLFTSRFGSVVEKAIKSRGFKPVSNLTGHLIQRYSLHAGKSLPNVFHISTSRISLGEVYGVEPFVTLTNAAGKVNSGFEAYIFRFLKHKSLKSPYAKQLLGYIEEKFRALPFAERWLRGFVPHDHFNAAFSELLSSKSLMSYPVFIEASGKTVAQAEHTVLIVEDGCLVLT